MTSFFRLGNVIQPGDRFPLGTGYGNQNIHLVMHTEDNKVFYTKSTDAGQSWLDAEFLGDGTYPAAPQPFEHR